MKLSIPDTLGPERIVLIIEVRKGSIRVCYPGAWGWWYVGGCMYIDVCICVGDVGEWVFMCGACEGLCVGEYTLCRLSRKFLRYKYFTASLIFGIINFRE